MTGKNCPGESFAYARALDSVGRERLFLFHDHAMGAIRKEHAGNATKRSEGKAS